MSSSSSSSDDDNLVAYLLRSNELVCELVTTLVHELLDDDESQSSEQTDQSAVNENQGLQLAFGSPVTDVVESPVKDDSAAAQEMGHETVNNGDKRGRDEEHEENAKKAKVDAGPVAVGYKSFETSVQIFDYFFKFLHFWPPNLNVNKYEHAMLLDLLKKGHLEAEKKIGSGIHAFQVRYHPQWKTRCFFLVREDESADDFCFRKCVDHILPLPENMTVKYDVNKVLGGGSGRHKGGGGGGGGGGPR